MSITTDICGHRGCDNDCLGDLEVTEEGWKFLEDLYNNPPQAIIDDAKRVKELYKDFDWDKLHEGVPFPIGDEEE